ncbi:L,D-transpeptidase family protein [Roseiterribacter gracilis]|uniref:Peptidoglycan-binding protein n=1 Tax=Roseiterribacter gracilis TaxID=2812848 RepID=A0A8S8X9X6_9PROT|nr:peptidoglycan-binding protein [Rhodospirillales bacterium TMPK1]
MRFASLLRPVAVWLVLVGVLAWVQPAQAAADLQRRAATAEDAATLDRFYAPRGWEPAWIEATGPNEWGQAALNAIAQSDADGLDPQRYHTAEIMLRAKGDATARLDADLLLTRALLRYTNDLRFGQVAPGAIDERGPDVEVGDPVPLLAGVRMAPRDQAAAAFASLAPQTAEYRALKRALGIYRTITKTTASWPQVPSITGPTALKPGQHDAVAVPALRERMIAGGWHANGQVIAEPDLYDDALAEAVMDFQQKHGIDADGAIGKNTRAALNATPADRAKQIAVNLERARWLGPELKGRHVLVNIGSFWLTAIEDGKTVLQMPVVVGAAYRQTPTFSSKITALVVNPRWTVPRTIAVKDILPKVRQDPGYMQVRGLEVYDGRETGGGPIDPYEIDWKRASILRYRLVHPPGPKNPLGRFKFVIPNTDDIYLHDTPETAKFQRDLRFFSSGCVRVGDARALASFVLPTVQPNKIDEALNLGSTVTISAAHPVPVHLIYRTAWLDETGNLVLGQDFYGRDSRLLQAVERPRAPVRARTAAIGN